MSIVAREGEQVENTVNALSKCIPSLDKRLRLGVVPTNQGKRAVRPRSSIRDCIKSVASHLWSSAMMTIILGESLAHKLVFVNRQNEMNKSMKDDVLFFTCLN